MALLVQLRSRKGWAFSVSPLLSQSPPGLGPASASVGEVQTMSLWCEWPWRFIYVWLYFRVLVYIHFIFVSSWHVVGRVHHGRDGQRNSAVSWHWPYPSLGPRVSVQSSHLIPFAFPMQDCWASPWPSESFCEIKCQVFASSLHGRMSLSPERPSADGTAWDKGGSASRRQLCLTSPLSDSETVLLLFSEIHKWRHICS